MTLARIRKGDEVIVLTGRERGKRGVVREVLRSEGRAIVQELNIAKRHRRNQGAGQPGGIIDVEQPIHLSNLAPIDPKTGKPTRVRSTTLTTGKKVRVAVRSGEQIGKD